MVKIDAKKIDVAFLFANPLLDSNGKKLKCKLVRHLEEYQWMLKIDSEGNMIKRAITNESLEEIIRKAPSMLHIACEGDIIESSEASLLIEQTGTGH